jgi:hypothetical protein
MCRHHLAVAATILALAVACSSDGFLGTPDAFPHAAATRACGPADGPAVAIYLTTVPVESLEPQRPYARIAIWQPQSKLAGGSWLIAAGDTAAAAWYFTGQAGFEVATHGRVTVSSVEPDTTIQGFADLTFPVAGRIRGGFRGIWISGSPLCG